MTWNAVCTRASAPLSCDGVKLGEFQAAEIAATAAAAAALSVGGVASSNKEVEFKALLEQQPLLALLINKSHQDNGRKG